MQKVTRLTTIFRPENYNLSLSMEREARTFHGLVTITGETLIAGEIRLHSKDLTIESVTFDGKEATFATGDHDELIITHTDISLGKHIVVLKFAGAITDGMHGLYPCYFEDKGIKKELLATQFESHHAREAFPCIDEPAGKATFDVTLTTEAGVTVLGNMPLVSQKTDNDLQVTTFQTTPRMSPYLLAWVVGELQSKSGKTKSGVEVNIWATPTQPAESLDFALDIATRTIDFYDEYFGVAYPLPKSDHVALPDFTSGAMENWGLVTYREVALLADPKTTSINSKHYIATVIAHELSHQWFGNLVTMDWWNDLWLNESFASMMEYLAVDALEPSWKIWFDFAGYESILALRRDSLDNVQAIQVEVNQPDEIDTLFDPAIVYAKGSRLLRMLQSYIGDVDFQKGLQLYFKQHAYQNTTANDLWTALSTASGKDIAGFMTPWIIQSGYPVVHVTQKDSTITLTQEQFFVGPHEPSKKLWPIPLGSSSKDIPALLDQKSLTVTRKDKDLLQFNVNDSAHFITHYDDVLFAELLTNLPKLSPLSRLQLLHEQTLLARGGVISSAQLIPLLQAFKDETMEPVWDLIGLAAGELRAFVENDGAAEQKLRDFNGELAKKEYERLGWDAIDGEPESDTKLRSTILGMMLYSERQDVVDEALKRYAATDFVDLDPEQRSLIAITAVRNNQPATIIDDLLKLHQTTSSSELQNDISNVVTATKDKEVIAMLLNDKIKDTSFVRQQDLRRWFVWLIRNRYGRELTWKWMRDNWDWIAETYKGDKSYDDFPKYSAGALVTAEQLEEYKAFFTPMLSNTVLKRNIEIGIGEITGRVELLEREGDSVRSALKNL